GDGSRVLVSGWGSNRALVIDTGTDRVIGEVPVAQPHNGTLSRDGHTGWVASQQQGATAIVRLDLAAWKEVARVSLDKTPRGLELSPDGGRVFFTLAGVNAMQPDVGAAILAQAPVRAVAAAPSGKSKSITLGGVTYADHGTKDVRNRSKLELEADDYYFSPTFLQGTPGQRLTLVVESEAST